MEQNCGAHMLKQESECGVGWYTSEADKRSSIGCFITRRHWEKRGRDEEAKSFKRLGRLNLVEVEPKNDGPLVNGPYLKRDCRKAFLRRESEIRRMGIMKNPSRKLLVEVNRFITRITPLGVPKVPRVKAGVESKRGEIRSFGRRPRCRLMRRILKMNEYPVAFATVTYDDTVIFPLEQEEVAEKVHKDIHRLGAWMKKSFRRIGVVWRIGWEPRKSGFCAGWIVPHVHFLIYGVKTESEFYALRAGFLSAWLRYTGTKNPEAFKVTFGTKSFLRLDGKKAVMYYISHYTAKESKDMGFKTGRHWGQFGSLPEATGIAIEVDVLEAKHLVRFLDRWFMRKYPGRDYIKKTIWNGESVWVYLNDMEMSGLLELASELGEIPF
jgi:hypothetical protein